MRDGVFASQFFLYVDLMVHHACISLLFYFAALNASRFEVAFL